MNLHGHRLPMRLSRRHERWIYITASLLFLSGAGWLAFHYALAKPNDFGEAHHPSEPWWLRLHGAAAMGFLIALGSLLPGHISRGLQLRRNLASGLTLLCVVSLLVLTAYGLYYAGDEAVRPWLSLVHWAAGLLSSAALLIHVWMGKKREAHNCMAAGGQMRQHRHRRHE